MALNITVFLSGACVMILELVGTRILTPYFGGTIEVWTSIIAIILLSLSLGYWWGGKKADQNPSYNTLYLIILFSSFFVLISFVTRNYYLPVLESLPIDFRLKTIFCSFILFFPVNFLLGMISPYTLRLKLKKINQSGSISGNMYAISTLGSIIGTFVTGFILVPRMYVTHIVYLVSLILFVNSILIYGVFLKKKLLLVLTALLFLTFISIRERPLANKGVLLNTESMYGNLIVFDKQNGLINGKTSYSRYLILNSTINQSGMNLKKPNELLLPYTKYFRLAEHINADLNNVLLIGGGAFSYPKYYIDRHPKGTIDVVEIDAKVTEIAKRYFFLKDVPQLNIYALDGRVFLNKNTKKYDAIIIDAFSSFAPPYQLTTKETAELVFNSLKDNGIVILNIIASIEGERSRFFEAELNTYSAVFPQTYAFNVDRTINPELIRNIVLIGMKNNNKLSLQSNDKEIQKYLNTLIPKKDDDKGLILTDNYAPVETLFVR